MHLKPQSQSQGIQVSGQAEPTLGINNKQGQQGVRLEDPSFPLWLGLLQLDPTTPHRGLTLSLSFAISAGGSLFLCNLNFI